MAMAGRVFVNYRRADDPGFTHALCQHLERAFPDDLFVDYGEMEPGDVFAKVLEDQVAACDVLLAVIGPRWATLLAERVDALKDYVVIELASALAQGKRVIPVLVGGASMPKGDTLPRSISELAGRHAVSLRSGPRFKADCEALIEAIKNQLDIEESERKRKRAGKDRPSIEAIQAGTDNPLDERKRESIKESLGLGIFLLVGACLLAYYEAQPLPAQILTESEERALKPRESFKECGQCPVMVVVRAGKFMRGSPPEEPSRGADEGPVREVKIDRPFAVGKYEVTLSEWESCVDAGGCNARPNVAGLDGRLPVFNVSWDDIDKEYLTWLRRETGKSYRLLTEAEWEYAARAGKVTRYAFGDTIYKTQAQYSDPTIPKVPSKWRAPFADREPAQVMSGIAHGPKAVGTFPPNDFGLHDMHGNVSEWVQDCYRDGYKGAPDDGTAVIGGDCPYRVRRGGSWSVFSEFLRSASRAKEAPREKARSIGFRVARSLAPPL
jgi:formylglycine-generating enzyme required for sulfatase activity